MCVCVRAGETSQGRPFHPHVCPIWYSGSVGGPGAPHATPATSVVVVVAAALTTTWNSTLAATTIMLAWGGAGATSLCGEICD